MGTGTTKNLRLSSQSGGNPMTLQLQQAIDLAQSLSMVEKLELLTQLSVLIQSAHHENQVAEDDDDIGFSPESFRRSWEQAVTGQTLPASVLWEDDEIE
jgi:hypothetical protein